MNSYIFIFNEVGNHICAISSNIICEVQYLAAFKNICGLKQQEDLKLVLG